jgi:hypothetical protein
MRRSVTLVVLSATILLAACGSGTGPTTTTGTPAASAQGSTGASAAQFGGDPCSALTSAEITAATFPQGPAVFASTDTQKDAASGQPVVCQYLVTFGSNPSIVGVAVSLMDDTEYGNRAAVSLIAPPVAVPGVGSEAWLVQSAPGLYEVYVSAAHGKFKLGAQSKDTAIALAKLAAARD